MRLSRFLPLFSCLLGACATMPAGYEQAQRDPWEGFNRNVYAVNDALDGAIIKPVAQGYRAVVPPEARQGVTNVFDNVDEPVSFVSAVLQGKFKRAFRAVDRFVINTTLGAGGLGDPASELGLTEQPEDLGQVLAAWGIGSGPYLVLPLLGPSTLRDAVGLGVERTFSPWGRFQDRTLDLTSTEQLGVTAGEVIDLRANLIVTADPVIENSFDPYATVRSAYIQARLGELHDGAVPEDDGGAFGDMEEFEYEEEPAFEESEPDITEPLAPQPGDDPEG